MRPGLGKQSITHGLKMEEPMETEMNLKGLMEPGHVHSCLFWLCNMFIYFFQSSMQKNPKAKP